ncbi:capsular polysaccharide export protein, LipB/KpsS family [Halobellus limi]|uniref:Capsule polysaccharide biosynthesis protein n=1 Tax=Halobellus limi TaxID=699433 RepID=A0A1H5UR97_9EURY|nr:hypothetical protein [Halobellus limi]QCC46951.1 hypothetical protein DV707_04295 [Halobellus limi]SEF77536.1 Capsule polysaccharide biosynthesis protein [Halobellus limi]
MSKEVLLVTSWNEFEIKSLSQLAEELETRDYTVHLFSPAAEHIDRNKLSGNVYQQLESQPSELPTPEQIESECGIPSLPHLYFTDKQYFALSESEVVLRSRSMAAGLKQTFAETDLDFVFQGRGGEIQRLLAHYLAQQHDVASVWGEFSPFENRTAFSTQLDGKWDSYTTIPDYEIPQGEREDIDEYINSFTSDKKVYNHSMKNNDARKIIKKVTDTVKSLSTAVAGNTPNNPYRYGIRKLRANVYGRINNRILPSIKKSKKLCEKNKFVLLPLQYPIESRLTVFSPEFFDQSFLIDYLSRILPSNIKLFVKQHPNHPGKQSPAWIQRVSRRNTVELLHPSFNTHEVIEQAEGVVVTNNTVGFEAIFYNVPLVVLGNAFYGDVPAATRVSDLSSLPEAMARALGETVSDSVVRSSIYSLREATYPGMPIHEAAARNDSDQLSIIVDSLLSFVEDHT